MCGAKQASALQSAWNLAVQPAVNSVSDFPAFWESRIAGFEGAPEDVLKHKRPEISDMGGAVNRRTAAVKPKHLAVQRQQLTVSAGKGVEKAHGAVYLRCAARASPGLRIRVRSFPPLGTVTPPESARRGDLSTDRSNS